MYANHPGIKSLFGDQEEIETTINSATCHHYVIIFGTASCDLERFVHVQPAVATSARASINSTGVAQCAEPGRQATRCMAELHPIHHKSLKR